MRICYSPAIVNPGQEHLLKQFDKIRDLINEPSDKDATSGDPVTSSDSESSSDSCRSVENETNNGRVSPFFVDSFIIPGKRGSM